ncbi:phenol hydroxylase subunit P4 [Gordonia hydrophobica]|uniref:Phenol hydroxylase subunit P4 n=1 Tax=Gordonia hydrophobica TaxID=40516 RepID=A0ABZ2U5W4_9ACTN|nr:phenol hydroxylase subunit P4 [Gordonia hydrophobica]MBM7367845.1 phenol hydroxylase P4 protein [Gordonia hydrophobica]
MAVKALYEYKYPAADRAEIFGEDQLLYVHWRGNPLFCSAACFRAPQAMSFNDFVAEIVNPWAASDPDFEPSSITDWQLFDDALDPGDGSASLTELGIGHKALLKFTTA